MFSYPRQSLWDSLLTLPITSGFHVRLHVYVWHSLARELVKALPGHPESSGAVSAFRAESWPLKDELVASIMLEAI